MIMYIESEKDLEKMIEEYQSIKKLVLEIERKESIKSYKKKLKNTLNDFEMYYKSEKGQNEIVSEYNLVPGYYDGTFETQETLLNDFYLGRKEAIKEEIFNDLDIETQEEYQNLLNLKEQMTSCEMIFTDVKYELDLSDDAYKVYKEMFEK